MFRLNEAEYALLLAHITYSVELKASVGVPEMAPVPPSRVIPVGSSGSDSHEVMSPPEVIGTRSTTERLTTRSSVLVG